MFRSGIISLTLLTKQKWMARQRDPAGMEKPPGCEPDGL
jgi:hypothetical protein